MGFVVYDVETSGLNKRFDQILQFAAIRTNEDLETIDQVELRGRLLPNIVPAPQALQITGANFEDLIHSSRPSHYEMISQIHATFLRWSPAMFVGFNSIAFDEEFVRQAFYQCLQQPIYVTNTNGNARADVLKLARAVATLRPDVLSTSVDAEGRRIFRLGELARANGIEPGRGHDAMADVETTLALCRLVRERAPDLWSSFLRFANKAAVVDFIREEEAFAVFEFYGGVQDVHCVTRVGTNPNDANIHYCLDLTCDLDALRRMTHVELVAAIRGDRRPLRRLKVNASPLVANIWDLEPRHLGDFVEADLVREAQRVRGDEDFVRRLNFAASECETVWPASPYVEMQIYNGFIGDAEAALCRRFHEVPWADRLALVQQFRDDRLKRLAQRLIYFERPDLLDESRRVSISMEVERRVCGTMPDVPWLTIPQALTEIDTMLASSGASAHDDPLQAFRTHLVSRLARAPVVTP
jgi:exodeoxyribonuclease-1